MPEPVEGTRKKGYINAVPCPCCEEKNDFLPIRENVENGTVVLCDFCDEKIFIEGVKDVKIVTVCQCE